MLHALLPADFYASIAQQGATAPIATVMEMMAAHQPRLSQPLQQQMGVLLFSALDAAGDGSVATDRISETLEAAITQHPQLLECFVEVARGLDAPLGIQ